MNMDLLSWINSNPTCKLRPTRKRYYERFLYRVRIYAPFARVLRKSYTETPEASIWSQIHSDVTAHKDRVNQQIRLYISTYWADKAAREINDCQIDQLEYLYRKLRALSDKIRLRVEVPYIEIYAESEDTILDIVKTMPERKTRVMDIHMPASGRDGDYLLRGEIYRPKSEYDYQVNLRTILLTTGKRTQIYDYLINLGNLVKLTPGLIDALTRPKYAHSDNMWIHQCYFYTNDTSICTFLNLIEPRLVHKILKIAKRPTK